MRYRDLMVLLLLVGMACGEADPSGLPLALTGEYAGISYEIRLSRHGSESDSVLMTDLYLGRKLMHRMTSGINWSGIRNPGDEFRDAEAGRVWAAGGLRDVAVRLCFREPPAIESGNLSISLSKIEFDKQEELPFRPERLEVPFDAERIPTVQSATPCWEYLKESIGDAP